MFNEGTVIGGETNVISASCDDGDRLLSGGYFDVQLQTHVTDNYPFDESTWEVFMLNTGIADDDVAVYVLCADFAPLHEGEPAAVLTPQRDEGE